MKNSSVTNHLNSIQSKKLHLSQRRIDMTVKEFLRDIKRKKSAVDILSSQIENLRAMAVYKVPALDPNGGSSGTRDPHSRENILAKVIDMTNELDEMKLDYLEDIEKATRMILSLSDEKTLRVFHERYLEFRTWESIADRMDITFQWVHELHKRGLIELDGKYRIE